MKKFKHIVAVLLKSAVIAAPGIAALIWLHDTHGWLVSTLAALGIEFITGVIITLSVVVAAKAKVLRDERKLKNKADDAAE